MGGISHRLLTILPRIMRPFFMTSLMTIRAHDNKIGSCTADGDTVASFATLSPVRFRVCPSVLGSIEW